MVQNMRERNADADGIYIKICPLLSVAWVGGIDINDKAKLKRLQGSAQKKMLCLNDCLTESLKVVA